MVSERQGVSQHQHAILLHELANHIRATIAADTLDKHQLLAALDSMRAFLGAHFLRLLDDSRARAAALARAEQAEAREAVLRQALAPPVNNEGYICLGCGEWAETRADIPHTACSLSDEARAALAATATSAGEVEK